MLTSEWVAISYFTYLSTSAWFLRSPLRARGRIILVACAVLSLIIVLALFQNQRWSVVARAWLPGVYLLLGYWASGLFFIKADTDLERRLVKFDERIFAMLRLPVLLRRAPRVVLEYLEVTYLLCYVQVPAGFFIVYWTGGAADADRFWTIVLLAAFFCYGALPWVQTRAPRQLAAASAIDERALFVRALNMRVLHDASIGVNTLPSGHAAGSLATALALADRSVTLGLIFTFFGMSISLASVIGRYHYIVDALLGIAVAIATYAAVSAFWPI